MTPWGGIGHAPFDQTRSTFFAGAGGGRRKRRKLARRQSATHVETFAGARGLYVRARGREDRADCTAPSGEVGQTPFRTAYPTQSVRAAFGSRTNGPATNGGQKEASATSGDFGVGTVPGGSPGAIRVDRRHASFRDTWRTGAGGTGQGARFSPAGASGRQQGPYRGRETRIELQSAGCPAQDGQPSITVGPPVASRRLSS